LICDDGIWREELSDQRVIDACIEIDQVCVGEVFLVDIAMSAQWSTDSALRCIDRDQICQQRHVFMLVEGYAEQVQPKTPQAKAFL